jgi:hypothetical protein
MPAFPGPGDSDRAQFKRLEILTASGLVMLAQVPKTARAAAELLPAGDDPELIGRFGARN